MSPHPASEEEPICGECSSEVLRSDLQEFEYECPHCGTILSAEHVNKGFEKIAEIRLNSSTIQQDVESIESRFDDPQFFTELNGPVPPEGAQQASITVYRLYIPPERH